MQSDRGNLFIGGISWETKEEHLREYFGNFGEVVEAVIMKDRNTGRARGFGFVVFSDPAVAEHVIVEKHLIDGRMVEAKKAVPKDDQLILNRNNNNAQGSAGPVHSKKIFVGGLPSTITESDFKKYFDQFGTIIDVVVMYDHNTQRPRGFGFITYDSEDVVDTVLLKPFHELYGKMVEVKRAVPKELSLGTNMRSSIGGCNYEQKRMNNFINGHTQGYNPCSIGGYNGRMESRLGLPNGARNGIPSFGHGFGMGMNSDPKMLTSFGENPRFSRKFGHGRGFSPFYNRSSIRYSSRIGYGEGTNTSSGFSSISGNSLGNGDFNYHTSSTSPNLYINSRSGSLSGFGNNHHNWKNAASVSAQVGGSTSSYVNTNLSYGEGDSNFDFGGSSFGPNGGSSAAKASRTFSTGKYEGTYVEIRGENPVFGDSTWQSSPSVRQDTGPFSYGFGNAPLDIIAKGSTSYVGNYNVPNRQANRGKLWYV